jgi:biopolymer transport protein ExbD
MEIIRARKPRLSLDLAPLIDVVFQLLVFFMLTSVFIQPAMKIVLPQAASTEETPREEIMISIDPQGEIFINEQRSSFADLKDDLAVHIGADPQRPVHIRGDQDMPYKYFVEVMDVARQLGARQVLIVHQRY